MGDQQPNANTSAGGQAPTDGQGQAPTTGQQPQAGAATTPQSPSQAAPQAPSSSGQQLTPEQLAAEVARLTKDLSDTRREAAQHRTELKKFQDAQLTDQQKLEKRATDAEAQLIAYQQRIATYEVKLAASALGIIDPDLAALAIREQLKYGDDGTPTNAQELLTELVKNKPYLVGQPGAQAQGQQQSQRAPAQSGGATNPGSGARTGTFTRAQIKAMSPAEYARNQDAIYEAMKNGQIK